MNRLLTSITNPDQEIDHFSLRPRRMCYPASSFQNVPSSENCLKTVFLFLISSIDIIINDGKWRKRKGIASSLSVTTITSSRLFRWLPNSRATIASPPADKSDEEAASASGSTATAITGTEKVPTSRLKIKIKYLNK